jgi:ABC-type phosphate transport system permease subunit
MNENTAKLIEQLAQKLGTTSEYLWRILLKQAAVDATTTLIQFLAVILFGITLWKIHKKLMKKVSDDKYAETGYDKYEEGAIVPMILSTVVFAILFIICFCCIGDIINGYFNPEYWALKTVLNSIR